MREPSLTRGEPESRYPIRGEMNGTEPITDYDSKTVMIAAERHDNIEITEVVNRLAEGVKIPNTVSVIKRTDTYYGPKLMVHAALDGVDYNFLLTAPGPDSQLCLWAGKTTKDNIRQGWFVAAEVKASMAAEQPPYETCVHCGELVRTIEHEREVVLGSCSRAPS